MRVRYHGSQTQFHGEGRLEYDPTNNWHIIYLDNGGIVYRIRRESFTILEGESLDE